MNQSNHPAIIQNDWLNLPQIGSTNEENSSHFANNLPKNGLSSQDF